MDTSTLVVGQDVFVVSNSGKAFMHAIVSGVTPEYVEVQTANHVLGIEDLPHVVLLSSLCGPTMRFDSEGMNGTDREEGRNAWGFDWYPWHIDNVPFEKRRASGETQREAVLRPVPSR